MKRPSLRARLLLGILLAQALLLGAMAYNSARLIDLAIKVQIQHRVDDISRLLSAALSVPMLQRDLAAIKDEVENIGKDPELVYLSVKDRTGFVVAKFERPDQSATRFNARSPIKLGSGVYGEIEFGLSGHVIEAARRQAYVQNISLALAAFVTSWILLFLVARWVSRQFHALADASTRVAAGDYGAQIPLQGEPELDRLASAFNSMSESVHGQVLQLQESEARFHAIADYTHDLEFWISPAGQLLWVNPSAERMLGYSVDECMAMKDFPLGIVHPEDRAAAEPRLREALNGSVDSGYLFRACRKDGSVFWASASWLPIYDKQANSLGLLIAFVVALTISMMQVLPHHMARIGLLHLLGGWLITLLLPGVYDPDLGNPGSGILAIFRSLQEAGRWVSELWPILALTVLTFLSLPERRFRR